MNEGWKMNHVRFLWLYITNARFRYYHKHTLKYALRFFGAFRGNGATDVLMFQEYSYAIGVATPTATMEDLPNVES